MNKTGYLLAFSGLVLMGSAGAAGGDRPAPADPDARFSGRVRPETCHRPAYPREDRRQDHQGAVTFDPALLSER